MTAFIADLSEQAVVVAMDTLATEPDGTPAFFTNKAVHLAHIQTLIAGTGCAGFSNRWALHAIERMQISSIENLDYHTPDGLRQLWISFCKEYDVPESITTTVYQFGYSTEKSRMLGFAYRSTNDFTSEPRNYGMMVKPECDVPEEGAFLDIIQPIMLSQRKIQRGKPKMERIHIGGQCMLGVLQPNNYTSLELFRFDDFEQQLQQVLTKY